MDILDIVVEESEHDKIPGYADLMKTLIFHCRRALEDMKQFTGRFKNAVSLYYNQVGPLTIQVTRQ